MSAHHAQAQPTPEHYSFRDLVNDVLSPGAVGTLEELAPQIREIYGLDDVLERELPLMDRDDHEQLLVNRIQRIVRLLPPHVSPMPNEVFTALEFLLYEIDGEPVQIGVAIARLETLAREIRSRPLLHDLLIGRAN